MKSPGNATIRFKSEACPFSFEAGWINPSILKVGLGSEADIAIVC